MKYVAWHVSRRIAAAFTEGYGKLAKATGGTSERTLGAVVGNGGDVAAALVQVAWPTKRFSTLRVTC
jgi:hypothetical protein